MTPVAGAASPKPVVVQQSKAARAKLRNEKLVQAAGAPGHILAPGSVPRHAWRTDLVTPVLSFVVYGIPAPQGSKSFKGFQGGKPVLAEQSDALAPWRRAVREMATLAVRDHTKRTGRPWEALNEPVMVSAVVTVPATAAATQRGDVYAAGTPDLDKLQRGIGDALAPTPIRPTDGANLPAPAKAKVRAELLAQRRSAAVLHDDSRIVVWDHCVKVYPLTTGDSLGYPGVTIQVWRLSDLDAANTAPIAAANGQRWMTAGDLREWTQPASGETWPEITQRLLEEPQGAAEPSDAPVEVHGRNLSDRAARRLLAHLLAHGPNSRLPITLH